MAKQRYVNTKFWNDTFISQLNPIEKLLFIYFITNEHTNICGIYELPLKIIAIETGIDESMLKKMLGRLRPKIFYVQGWVIVTNFPRHQAPDNPKIQKGIETSISLIPKDILDKAIGYGYPIDSVYNYINPNININSNSNEREDTQLVTKEVKEIKLPFGEFQKVKLTSEEYQKLCERLGEKATLGLIETLDSYLATRNKKYTSHYAVILNWSRRNNQGSNYKTKGITVV